MASETAVVEKKWTVDFPDIADEATLDTFIEHLQSNTDKRGVKKLLIQVSKYKNHTNLVNAFAERALKTAQYINNGRGPTKVSNKLQKTATLYYESLSTPGLRMHCNLYNVDYDSFDTQEAIIDTLVEKHLEMMVS